MQVFKLVLEKVVLHNIHLGDLDFYYFMQKYYTCHRTGIPQGGHSPRRHYPSNRFLYQQLFHHYPRSRLSHSGRLRLPNKRVGQISQLSQSHRDTAHITDTISKIVEVPVKVSKWQQLKMDFGELLILAFLLSIALLLIKSRKKSG